MPVLVQLGQVYDSVLEETEIAEEVRGLRGGGGVGIWSFGDEGGRPQGVAPGGNLKKNGNALVV